MANYGDEIHEALHASLYDHNWLSVVMTHRAAPEVGYVRTSGPGTVKPTSIVIDQNTSTFDDAESHRRDDKTDRSEWIWDALVSFAGAVSHEEWETKLENPIILSRDATGLARQVTITLLDSTYTSPARQQSTSGSSLALRFAAALSPL